MTKKVNLCSVYFTTIKLKFGGWGKGLWLAIKEETDRLTQVCWGISALHTPTRYTKAGLDLNMGERAGALLGALQQESCGAGSWVWSCAQKLTQPDRGLISVLCDLY